MPIDCRDCLRLGSNLWAVGDNDKAQVHQNGSQSWRICAPVVSAKAAHLLESALVLESAITQLIWFSTIQESWHKLWSVIGQLHWHLTLVFLQNMAKAWKVKGLDRVQFFGTPCTLWVILILLMTFHQLRCTARVERTELKSSLQVELMMLAPPFGSIDFSSREDVLKINIFTIRQEVPCYGSLDPCVHFNSPCQCLVPIHPSIYCWEQGRSNF